MKKLSYVFLIVVLLFSKNILSLESVTRRVLPSISRSLSYGLNRGKYFQPHRKFFFKSDKKTLIPLKPNFNMPKLKYKDLKGFDAIIGKIPDQVKECAEIIKFSNKYAEMGANVPRGLLMVGSPGVGKTRLAKAIAEEAGAHYKFISATEFKDKYYGNSEKNIREAFSDLKSETAFSSKKAILFIDEIDSIGSRTDQGLPGPMSGKGLLSELLSQMDGITANNENIFVIGATNCASLLDPALKRPGRFDKIIEVSLPDTEDIKNILKFYLSFTKYDTESITEEFINEISDNILGVSPAAIKYIVNEAAILAVRSESEAINKTHIIQAIKRLYDRNKSESQSIF